MKRYLIFFSSLAVVLAISAGAAFAIRSPLFIAQVVEVDDQPENAPVTSDAIIALAAIPQGEASLYSLDLKAIEKRILKESWIHHVTLVKRFPQTLSIHVTYRDPVALFQAQGGTLSYLDTDGQIFGSVNVLARSELPLVGGIERSQAEKIKQALAFLDFWKKSEISGLARVGSLSWSEQRGFRAWIVYPGAADGIGRARSELRLGDAFSPEQTPQQLHRLTEVIAYLRQHAILARQISVDSGKKIVVRTARSS